MAEKESLDQYLIRLIAEQVGIREEEVTVEYIRKWREKNYYPVVRFTACYPGLISLTRNEIDILLGKVDKTMEDTRLNKYRS